MRRRERRRAARFAVDPSPHPAVVPSVDMERYRAELTFARPSELGEGSLWDDQRQRLLWVDIIGTQVMLFDPASGDNRSYDVGESVGTVVPTKGDDLLLALRSGFAFLNLQSGNVEHLSDPESDKPGNRFNDGKCDPQGRFWAGTMVEDGQQGNASLYCLGHDLTVTKHLSGITTSNGLVWSGDNRTFYYIDTKTKKIRAYDFEPASGTLSNERTAFEFEASHGSPDGMTIDEHDDLWVAMWGGSKVLRISPSSRRITAEVSVAATQVTSCAFGGPSLDDLFITTARVGLSVEQLATQPDAGSLFRVQLPVRGRPAARFAAAL